MSKELDDKMAECQQLLEMLARSQSIANGESYAGAGGPVAMRSAVMMGDINGVERILGHGTDINCELNPDGDTPLTASIHWDKTDLAIWLIDHGADFERGLKNGRTPLITAAGKGDVRVLEKLIEVGARVDVAMRNGSTALMYAVGKGCVDAARCLVRAGASRTLRDNEGWGLEDFARVSGMDLSALDGNNDGMGSSRISRKIKGRYDGFVSYFQRHPFGSIPGNMTVLSLLPPVDRVLILEMLFVFGLGDIIVIIDKLSMAYLKAGWRNLSSHFLAACCNGGFLDEMGYGYFVSKLSGLPIRGVSVGYEDALRKLPEYEYPGDPFSALLREFCERYCGDEVLCGDESTDDIRAFVEERSKFIFAVSRGLGR